jgi:hypothetical protein
MKYGIEDGCIQTAGPPASYRQIGNGPRRRPPTNSMRSERPKKLSTTGQILDARGAGKQVLANHGHGTGAPARESGFSRRIRSWRSIRLKQRSAERSHCGVAEIGKWKLKSEIGIWQQAFVWFDILPRFNGQLTTRCLDERFVDVRRCAAASRTTRFFPPPRGDASRNAKGARRRRRQSGIIVQGRVLDVRTGATNQATDGRKDHADRYIQ